MRLTPGIHIVDVPPPLGDGLPVMDVPVFIGFAERGPLDRPVALEDPAHYSAVFGGVLDLVPRLRDRRDLTEPPPMQRAHLPAAVASFFAGGGRRCYVIRVASDASDALFPVAGLRLASRRSANAPWQLSPHDFRLRAASPGAWADRHELAARIRASALHPADLVQPGDVLRVRQPSDSTTIGWLRVSRSGPLDALLASAQADDWLWTPALGDEAPGESPPAPVTGFDDPLAAADSPPAPILGSPPGVVSASSWLIERITLDLALRHPRQTDIRRPACGLSAGAANLPWFEADAAGRYDAGEALPAMAWPLAGVCATALADLACSPDGASPLEPVAGNWMLLPVAVDVFFGPWRAALNDGRDALSRNGLARYSAALFTDSAWSPRLRDAELLRWADDIRFFASAPRRLGGLHGALGRDDATSRDATWIAVPDASHAGWECQPAPPCHDGELLTTPDTPCPHEPLTAFDLCLAAPPPIPKPPRLHLDALRSGENTTAIAPADVSWLIVACDPAAGAPTSFEVQIAQRPDFSDQQPLPAADGQPDTRAQWTPGADQAGCVQPAVTPGPRHLAPVHYTLTLPSGLYFLRARSWRGGRYSDWSASVDVQTQAAGWRLSGDNPAQAARDSVAYTVHSALLDLCAATREHFALLSVPERWDAARLARHTAALRSHADTGFEATQASSFGALHHPWLLRREAASESASADASELHAHPPEGALLGMYARRSRHQGAWAAAGLEPLAEAFALAGDLAAEAIEAAFGNAIERRPRGIAATRANTLSDDVDWESIGVRRLFILLRRLARREGERYVFEPNDLTLRRSLERSFDVLLHRLMQRGAFRGTSAAESYLLRTASGARASEEIARGECSLDIRVAPSRPLRFLSLRVLRAGEQWLMEES